MTNSISESRLTESYELKEPIKDEAGKQIAIVNYAKSISVKDLEYLDSLNVEGKCKTQIEKHCKWSEYISNLTLEQCESLDSEDLAFLANKADTFIKKYIQIMYPELKDQKNP